MRGVALVTGSSSGFGLLACVELARAGFRVFGSMRDLGRAGKLGAAAAEAGVTVETVALDVTDDASVAAAVADVEARAERIDVIVNNAGFGIGGYFEDVTIDEFREQFETNFFGPIRVMQAVLPGMRARGGGRVINVSSIAGRVGNPGVSAYAASKWALEGLSESLRFEVRQFGVWVSLVEPGTYATDIFGRNRRVAKKTFDPSSPFYDLSRRFEKGVDHLVAKTKRDPREVARAIVKAATAKKPRMRYLVGDDARGTAFAKGLLPFGVFEAMVRRYVKGMMEAAGS